MELPELSNEPHHHAECCLSLSSTLIRFLSSLLLRSIKSGLVLSIGSGTGLLEALLHKELTKQQCSEIQIEGVEVYSRDNPLNSYLPEELTNVVDGTWSICHRAESARALLFVYPRTTSIVKSYLQSCSERDSNTMVVIWLGPKMDWPDFEPCFQIAGFKVVQSDENCGLVEYETLKVIRRIVVAAN